MIRTLLTTTALAAVLTTGAMAADDMKSTDATRSGESGSAVFNTMQDSKPMQSQGGYFSASPARSSLPRFLASRSTMARAKTPRASAT